MYTWERLTVASGDSLGPNIRQAFMSQTRTTFWKRFGKNMADENYTFSINDVNTNVTIVNYVIMSLAIFLQSPFRSIQNLCKPYPADLRLCTRVVELTTMHHVDQMQHKVHAQAQVNHTQAGVRHAHTNGPCKHVQVIRACRLCVRQGTHKQVHNTRACMTRTSTTHVPACMRYLPRQTGWQTCNRGQVKRRQVQKTCSASTRARRRTCRCRCPLA